MLGRSTDDSARAVDQLASEVVVGASSDAAEPWLAAGRILSRHQPDPRRHLTARAKLSAIVDGRDDRRGDDWTDARQLGKPPTSRIRAAYGYHCRVKLLNPTIELVELVQELAEDCSCQVRQIGIGDGGRCLRCEAPRALRQHDPMFGKEASRMVEQSGALAAQPIPCTMQ